jgi:hypothetical protein
VCRCRAKGVRGRSLAAPARLPGAPRRPKREPTRERGAQEDHQGSSPTKESGSGTTQLTESRRDHALVRTLLHRFAYRLGSDPALIDVPHALVAVPGTRCERVHPTRTVHVETWALEQRYALTDIERWLDQG